MEFGCNNNMGIRYPTYCGLCRSINRGPGFISLVLAQYICIGADVGGSFLKAPMNYPTVYTAGTAQVLSGAIVQCRALQPTTVGISKDHSLYRIAKSRKVVSNSMMLVCSFPRVNVSTREEIIRRRHVSGD